MAVTQLNSNQVKDSTIGIADLSATGTPSSTTFLRGDNTWAIPLGDTSYPIYNEGPTNKTYILDSKTTNAGTLTQIRGLKTATSGGGTCTIAIHINGVAVTFTGSVTTLNVTGTAQDVSIISGGTFAIGDRITYVITIAAAPVDLEATLKL